MITTKIDEKHYEVLHNNGSVYHVLRTGYSTWEVQDEKKRAIAFGMNKKKAIESLEKFVNQSQNNTTT